MTSPHRRILLAVALLAALAACDRERPSTGDTAAITPAAAGAPTDQAGTTPDVQPDAAIADTGTVADTATTMALDDERFFTQALAGGAAEVMAARLALEKSRHQGLRAFAQQLERDHSDANRQLAEASGKPAMPPADAAHQQAMDALKAKEGADFDRAWLEQMARDHATTIALFENAARSPQASAKARQLAGTALPKLRDHAQTTQRLRDELAGQ